jgi:hypothetical protein
VAGFPAFLGQAADKYFVLSTGHSTTGLDAIVEVAGEPDARVGYGAPFPLSRSCSTRRCIRFAGMRRSPGRWNIGPHTVNNIVFPAVLPDSLAAYRIARPAQQVPDGSRRISTTMPGPGTGRQPTTTRVVPPVSLWEWETTMEQQHNGSPTRRGSDNRNGTIEPGGVGYERAMIEFIRRWHRFGGGSARDIFAEFGLGEHEFFRRTLELLSTGPSAGINEETAEYIRKVCRWRLSAVRC